MTRAMLNGRLLPLEEAKVSVLDRSFLYGDGVFETLRVRHGRPFRWRQHLERLEAGARMLGIHLRWTGQELRAQAAELIEANAAQDSILRLHLSRGVGKRGYSPRGADQPLLVMTAHPPPVLPAGGMAEFAVVSSPWRLPAGDALGRWKSASKLLNVLARKAADEAGADEAFLLDTAGDIIEASGANVFWMRDGRLHTPPLSSGALGGITRAVILELARAGKRDAVECQCRCEDLWNADSVFLTQSGLGVIGVRALDARPLLGGGLASEWQSAYLAVLEAETTAPPPA